MKILLALLATAASVVPAAAQYYEDRRPPPPPGYYAAPPPPPYYEERRVPFGRHCEAFLRTGYGPRRLFCRIVDPKPLGEPCACPPPTPPGYEPGPFVGGRTVR